MAFPSSVGSINPNLDKVWDQMRDAVSEVKQGSQPFASSLAAGCNANDIISYQLFLVAKLAQLATLAAVPGIGAYAQAQISDPTFNIVNEYNALVAAMNAVGNWIVTNFPKGTGNYLQMATWAGNGGLTYQQFAPATLAPLLTLVNALIAQIN